MLLESVFDLPWHFLYSYLDKTSPDYQMGVTKQPTFVPNRERPLPTKPLFLPRLRETLIAKIDPAPPQVQDHCFISHNV